MTHESQGTPATALTPQQSFEKKLGDRIREDIGELMPDEALAQLIEKATTTAFFEERTETTFNNGYRREEITKPPWSVELIGELLKPAVDKAVKQWLTDNADQVEQLMITQLDGGVVGLIENVFKRLLQQPLSNFEEQIVERLRGNY